MELKVIAYARNGHTDKFGIPRQSREESPILTRIVFEPEFNVREALRGIEGYSHLWLIWGANLTQPLPPPSPQEREPREGGGLSWSPTVRPPRLGGNKRMGVFATRSPFRPNPIGLSSVRNLTPTLSKGEGVYIGESGRMELIVSGADVLDGTPIYDIKPYLSFSDSHPDARNGFAEDTKDHRLEVDWSAVLKEEDSENQIETSETDAEYPPYHPVITPLSPPYHPLWGHMEERTMRAIEYILSQDPRPGYQDDPKREYKLEYAGYTVTFVVVAKPDAALSGEGEEQRNQVVVVKNIEKC